VTKLATWDPAQYLRWSDHRLRPAVDLVQRIPLARPAHIVDLGCGTGNVTAVLRRVWPEARVTGVDASAAMLERARRLLGPDVALHRQALPDLAIDGVFDAAVSTLDGLNYLTPGELGPALMALHGRIRPGGWLVFDVHTDAMMDLAARTPVLAGESNGKRFTITNAVDADARTCDSRIEVTADSGRDAFSERHVQHFFTDGLIREALTVAGFVVQAVVDEYTHDPVSASTLRATWIARRPPSPRA
jgi:SAM-dependent methyltransferase